MFKFSSTTRKGVDNLGGGINHSDIHVTLNKNGMVLKINIKGGEARNNSTLESFAAYYSKTFGNGANCFGLNHYQCQ